MKIYETKV